MSDRRAGWSRRRKPCARELLEASARTGKLEGIEIEYYVGGGLPPPLYRSDQLRLLVSDGRSTLRFARPVYDRRYDPYPLEIFQMAATPDDVQLIAGLLLKSRIFSSAPSTERGT